ncbi:MAG: hypothetical protein K2X93_13910, partial [Candidatus Obscuribacterales bacterium]|nr:hypothetical protein [Candidatus Obscuribacterales bacterium]
FDEQIPDGANVVNEEVEVAEPGTDAAEPVALPIGALLAAFDEQIPDGANVVNEEPESVESELDSAQPFALPIGALLAAFDEQIPDGPNVASQEDVEPTVAEGPEENKTELPIGALLAALDEHVPDEPATFPIRSQEPTESEVTQEKKDELPIGALLDALDDHIPDEPVKSWNRTSDDGISPPRRVVELFPEETAEERQILETDEPLPDLPDEAPITESDEQSEANDAEPVEESDAEVKQGGRVTESKSRLRAMMARAVHDMDDDDVFGDGEERKAQRKKNGPEPEEPLDDPIEYEALDDTGVVALMSEGEGLHLRPNEQLLSEPEITIDPSSKVEPVKEETTNRQMLTASGIQALLEQDDIESSIEERAAASAIPKVERLVPKVIPSAEPDVVRLVPKVIPSGSGAIKSPAASHEEFDLSNVTNDIIDSVDLTNLSGNKTEISFLEEIVESELASAGGSWDKPELSIHTPEPANVSESEPAPPAVAPQEPILQESSSKDEPDPQESVSQEPVPAEPAPSIPESTVDVKPESSSSATSKPSPEALDAIAQAKAQLDPSILNLATQILSQAVNSTCSDVHFEPLADGLALRFMFDGELLDETILPAQIQGMLILCLKSMAGLDPTIVDRPQDKKFVTVTFGSPVEMRITSIPVPHGEMVAVSLKV